MYTVYCTVQYTVCISELYAIFVKCKGASACPRSVGGVGLVVVRCDEGLDGRVVPVRAGRGRGGGRGQSRARRRDESAREPEVGHFALEVLPHQTVTRGQVSVHQVALHSVIDNAM